MFKPPSSPPPLCASFTSTPFSMERTESLSLQIEGNTASCRCSSPSFWSYERKARNNSRPANSHRLDKGNAASPAFSMDDKTTAAAWHPPLLNTVAFFSPPKAQDLTLSIKSFWRAAEGAAEAEPSRVDDTIRPNNLGRASAPSIPNEDRSGDERSVALPQIPETISSSSPATADGIFSSNSIARSRTARSECDISATAGRT
mmetsp:Transcript_10389/g.21969  ORF Transcript_10389/g.21969 Transcript_10389/m.21969 type:complete len:202 (-) Transcript_10389:2261-2866(-)